MGLKDIWDSLTDDLKIINTAEPTFFDFEFVKASERESALINQRLELAKLAINEVKTNWDQYFVDQYKHLHNVYSVEREKSMASHYNFNVQGFDQLLRMYSCWKTGYAHDEITDSDGNTTNVPLDEDLANLFVFKTFLNIPSERYAFDGNWKIAKLNHDCKLVVRRVRDLGGPHSKARFSDIGLILDRENKVLMVVSSDLLCSRALIRALKNEYSYQAGQYFDNFELIGLYPDKHRARASLWQSGATLGVGLFLMFVVHKLADLSDEIGIHAVLIIGAAILILILVINYVVTHWNGRVDLSTGMSTRLDLDVVDPNCLVKRYRTDNDVVQDSMKR